MPAEQTRYFVTAAAGQLGRHVVAELARRVGPAAVVAVVRNPDKAPGAFPEGIEVRAGDYEKPDTLDTALAGADRLLLISSNAVGTRVPQHANVIDAAKRAGVKRIAYTSVLHADRSTLGLADEHRETEALLRASGIPTTLLRNGWYTENHAASIPPALQHDGFLGAAGEGRISAAAREDYAVAAAAALIGDAEGEDVVHELAGDHGFTLAEFAAELSRQAGREIPYVNLSEADYRGALVQAGLPEPVADTIANSDAAAANGALFDEGGALSRLIGRPTTSLATTIASSLKA
ncbi:SDR family oxidoreductase [Sphingomonas sp. HF-S3]|uniref:SDR family oxidoreductase n=1 Tax=Sphingomonas rustica TaxID=3103142 RepID=A0ABV0B7M3_9SPHN